jgi:hypothetical protein
MSQTRGKSKEHAQSYLSRIFADRQFESGRISDVIVKDSRAKALADLAQNDRFIWEHPVYKIVDGQIEKDEDGNQIIEKHARDPFTGPYVRNALRYLFLEDTAEWKKVSVNTFTASQIAFVATLVSSSYLDII